MGNFFVDITLKNAGDVEVAHRGLIAENQIRQVTLKALVDTGTTERGSG